MQNSNTHTITDGKFIINDKLRGALINYIQKDPAVQLVLALQELQPLPIEPKQEECNVERAEPTT